MDSNLSITTRIMREMSKQEDKKVYLENRIRNIRPQIDEVICIANLLDEKGINMPSGIEMVEYGYIGKATILPGEEGASIGIIVNTSLRKPRGKIDYGRYKYVGFNGFATNGDEIFSYAEAYMDDIKETEPLIEHMQRFLKQFGAFRAALISFLNEKFPDAHTYAYNIAWDVDRDDLAEELDTLSDEEIETSTGIKDYSTLTDDEKENKIDLIQNQQKLVNAIMRLPDSVEIPIHTIEALDEDEEAVSDFLSDEYGFCHQGFNLTDDTD